MTRIVAATDVGSAARLESLALRIFGRGDRPAGWWVRKLTAARIDDGLSRVAVADDADPRSPLSWLGYVLAGTPTDAAPFVRTAGVGVVAAARGDGIAARLLDAVSEAAAQTGHAGVEVVAAPRLRRWYASHGFIEVGERWTLQATGTSTQQRPAASSSKAPLPTQANDATIVAGTADAWASAIDRTTMHEPRAGRVWLSRVGPDARAWIVHAWTRHTEIPAAIAARGLRDSIPAGDALLVPLAPVVSWITANMVPSPFKVVQRGLVVRRTSPSAATDGLR